MTDNLGIIPAAGKAKRFVGIAKELLPLPDGRSLLEHAVDRLAFCDKIVIVTTRDKWQSQLDVVRDRKNIHLINQEGAELMGAIRSAYRHFDALHYHMTMPDTWCVENAFEKRPDASFSYGYFLTSDPERFGCLVDGYMVDKQPVKVKPSVAWGILSWARHINYLWEERRVEDYTQAINVALANGDCGSWPIGAYYDCANMKRYIELLNYLQSEYSDPMFARDA
jgi:hypothetical protein